MKTVVAVAADRAYLREVLAGAAENMADGVSTVNRGAILAAAGLMGLILAGTVALWSHYGTAVFFETIRAGFAACFG